MKVLITGGAGFIGSHLAAHHLALGDDVFVVDDLSTGSAANIAPFVGNQSFRFERADIVSWDKLEQIVASQDRIYHLAAVVGMFHVLEHPIEVTRVNVLGCERLLEAVARSGRKPQIVIASSSSVYGACPSESMREDADIVMNPESPLLNYALSKYTNEVQAYAYASTKQLPIVTVRLFNTIGPRQAGVYGFVVPRFVQQALAGDPISVFGDGGQTRSFCDVRDTVVMLAALAASPAAHGKVVNVGNSNEISINELARLVCERAGSTSSLRNVSYTEAYGQTFAQIPQRRPVLDRLHSFIDVRPQWTLTATIDDLIRHYREAGVPTIADAVASDAR